MSDLQDLYQEVVIDHNRRPRNFRVIEVPDFKAEGYNPLCGDRVTVFLKMDGEVIREIAFQGSGCAISTASASLMTEALKGKTIAQALALATKFHGMVTDDAAESAVEGPPLGKLQAFENVGHFPARVKCATLSWHTMRAALEAAQGVVSTE